MTECCIRRKLAQLILNPAKFLYETKEMNPFKDECRSLQCFHNNIKHLTLAMLHNWFSLSSLDMNLGHVNISPQATVKSDP